MIKTPRPDITIGIMYKTLLATLSSPNFNESEAQLFLTNLEEQMEINQLRGLQRPGTEHFLESLVVRLGKVARNAKT